VTTCPDNGGQKSQFQFQILLIFDTVFTYKLTQSYCMQWM